MNVEFVFYRTNNAANNQLPNWKNLLVFAVIPSADARRIVYFSHLSVDWKKIPFLAGYGIFNKLLSTFVP